MKIAVISTPVLPSKPYRIFQGYGGLEKLAGTWAEEFAKRDHQVALIGPPGSEAEGCEMILVQGSEQEVFGQYKDRLQEFDIWHDSSWQHWPVMAKIENPERYRNSKSMTLHHGVLGDIVTPPPLDKPNWLCFSAAQAQYIASTLHIETRYAHHGIPMDIYKPGAQKEDYYLILSRLSPEKGVLQAVKALKQAGKSVVVMADDQYIANAEYARLVTAECDGVQVRFISGSNLSLDAQLNWLQSARALVHTPLYPWMEIFGLVVAEALACGIPVIATRNGAIPEIVTHGKNGFLVGTPDEINQYLDRVEEIKPETCRSSVEGPFSISSMVDRHLKLMERVLDGQGW